MSDRNWRAYTLLSVTLLPGANAMAADLPQPCIAGSCGPLVGSFVTSGSASAVQSGTTLRVDQSSDKAILNWASFDVAAGRRVEFRQPDANSVALNRIFQASPSRIFGSVDANGQIYLINQNGILFGQGARINTAGLIASTLDINDSNFTRGILAPELLLRGGPDGSRAALASDGRAFVLDASGTPVLGSDGLPLPIKLVVEQGAEIRTNSTGERILLSSRTVENAGKLTAPEGQVILAAGEKVYLQASRDPALRGLVVEVDAGGTAWNRLTGDISVSAGNVTLVGLAVNQDGRASATTTVSANGSIRLLARDGGTGTDGGNSVAVDTNNPDGPTISARRGGTLRLGGTSLATVTPDATDTATAIDEQTQLPSTVEMYGRQVFMNSGASVVAPGGAISIRAQSNPGAPADAYDPEARIRIQADALIDASGTQATAPVTRNVVAVELRSNELRDSPVQRDGALRGTTVFVDARKGTPLADVSGAIANIPRTVQERTSAGGNVTFASDGDMVVQAGATVDVSGGQIQYQPGLVQTTQLVAENGNVVDIGQADPNVRYASLINPSYSVKYDRWGVNRTVTAAPIGRYDPGYVEGRNGGTLSVTAPVLALGGNLLGRTTIGDLQLTPATAPKGSLLRIGDASGGGTRFAFPEFRSPAINLVTTAPLLSVNDAVPLPALLALDLPTQFLTSGGFTRAEIYSNGAITLDQDRPLQLRPGSSLILTGHQVNILSDVNVAGGALAFSALQTNGVAGMNNGGPGLNIGESVTLDVRGNWTNDFLDLDSAVRREYPAYRNGGAIRLAANSLLADLTLGDNAALLASGGAQRLSNGRLEGGAGGLISISGGLPGSVMQIGSGTRVESFGVNSAGGGQFAFESTRVEIGNGDDWIAPHVIDTTAEDGGGAFRLGTELFFAHGFSSVSVTANGPSASESQPAVLSVLADTNIDAKARELQLRDAATTAATGTSVMDIADVYLPDALDRKAFTLGFAVRPREFTQVSQVGLLDMALGSAINLDPKSTVSFSAQGGMRLAGSIAAPAGSVTALLPVPPPSFDGGYLPDLRLDVLPGARIDVSGAAALIPNDSGLSQGSVLAGGSIKLLADRGSVILQGGATLMANGASAQLDLPDPTAAGGYRRETVASSAGSIALRAPESVLAAGEMQAHAGQGSTGTAAGGSLSIQLTRERGFSPGSSSGTYPGNDRVLRLVAGSTIAGSTLPSGLGLVPQDQIAAGGFDSLLLEADGSVELDAATDLSLARSLTVDSPNIGVRGDGDARLAAAYVSLGRTLSTASVAPIAGAGSLSVTADLIDLVGSSAVSGVDRLGLASTGDIRMRGVEFNGTNRGSLEVAGDIAFRARRIYPTTLTDFSIGTTPVSAGSINLHQNGSSPGLPLSAGGSLHLNAQNILQSGTLLAPFGRIALNAIEGVNFAPGSVTSVASDQTTPFGALALGVWQYDLGGTLVPQSAIPVRRVDVSASEVRMESGSTIDLSGGGDLYAYEWTPGTGGSKDALSATLSASAGRYAILPSMLGQSGTYDPQEFAGSGLRPGDSVYLAGSALLPEGRYPLLPARYALLPGAVLVEVVPKFTGATLDVRSSLPDGTPVVAGRRTFLDTGVGDTQLTGFAIRKGEQARSLATYADNLASSFFPAQATRLGAARAARPADAAAFGLNITSLLDARGTLKTSGATGGLGASLDIAAPRLEVHAGQSGSDASAVQISASTIGQWRPASLLLGGLRLSSTDPNAISPVSSDVHLSQGANLSLDEIILAGREGIRLDDGVTVRSASNSSAAGSIEGFTDHPATLGISGTEASGVAVLAVSDLRRLQVARSGSSGSQGQAKLASTATLASHSAMLVDAPGGAAISGTLAGDGAAWNLAAGRVSVADAARPGELTLTPVILDALGRARSVSIASASTIDFYQPARIGTAQSASSALADLQMSAVALRAAVPGADISLGAKDRLSLQGAAGNATAITPAGGLLSMSAREIVIGPGNLALQGFDSTVLNASGSLRGSGTGALNVAGTLDIRTPLVTADASANTTISSTGALTATAGGSPPAAATAPGLGGAMTLQGPRVDFSTRMLLPSGVATLNANQSLDIGDGARIDVAGVQVSAAGRTVAGHSGAIVLHSLDSLTAAAGATLAVGSALALDAGRLSVRAGGNARIDSQLQGAGADADAGGQFELWARSLSGFAGLNQAIEAGGFRLGQDIRVDTGDLLLAAGQRMTASQVSLTADDGVVRIDGSINARAVDERSSVALFGAKGVTLSASGAIEALGDGTDGRGGTVTFGTSAGAIDLLSGSTVATGGAIQNGRVLVRAPVSGGDVRVDHLGSRFDDVAQFTLEPYLTASAPASVGATQYATFRQSLEDFSSSAAPAITARLGSLDGATLQLIPGLEITRAGDLTLTANDFSSWRFGGMPANITVRATGSISVQGTLSDGFALDNSVSPALIDLQSGPAASFSFAAGSHLASANTLALSSAAAADFRLANNGIVRTTTGNLRVAAGRDLVFGTGSSLYTAGQSGFATEHIESGPSLLFPTLGGQLELRAGRDIIGSPVSQEVGAWQVRRGGRPAQAGAELLPTQWAINVSQFRWNAGSLGGGDVSVRAGRDVLNLSTAAADSAAASVAGGLIENFSGGTLNIFAGRDISSLFAHVTHGNNMLRAEGALGRLRPSTSGIALGSLLSIQDASVSIRSRTGIALESAFNPTSLVQPGVTPSLRSFYFTYDDESRLDAVSAAGTVALEYSNQRLAPFLRQQVVAAQPSAFALGVLPPSVTLQALTGDVSLAGSTTMFASDRGQLDIFAARDITTPSTATITMSDSSASLLPSPETPSNTAPSVAVLTARAASGRHRGDAIRSQIVAGRDMIGVNVSSAKPASVRVGRDVVDASLLAQNLGGQDVTSIVAGRDIRYSNQSTTRQIEVGGPGELAVVAGRDVDMGFSRGISTIGSILNPTLAGLGGADLSVVAGMGPGMNVEAFLQQVVAPSADYRDRLISTMHARQGAAPANFEAARAQFSSLDATEQLPYISDVFFSELVKSGREVNADPTLGFERGYAAIDALLPGSRSPEGGSGASPYAGDIRLAFSRIYTLADGNISLFAPGGLLNVGLANPPANLPVSRKPSDLGIVAQGAGDVRVFTGGDVLVNQSRMFTLGGGDIAVWSTTGDIDAGRGAKSSISAPPPRVVIDAQGNVQVDFGAAVAGSGIRTILTGKGITPGDVDLIAPAGIVNAGDAGIGSSGNINVAAQQVVGLDNIQFGGTSSGVPSETSSLGAALSGASAASTASSAAATGSVETRETEPQAAPLAQSAMTWLDVFVEGFGEETCKPTDEECLRRNRKSQ